MTTTDYLIVLTAAAIVAIVLLGKLAAADLLSRPHSRNPARSARLVATRGANRRGLMPT